MALPFLSTIEQIIELPIARFLEALAHRCQDFVERLAVRVNEALEVLLRRLSQRAGLLLGDPEMMVIETDGAGRHSSQSYPREIANGNRKGEFELTHNGNRWRVQKGTVEI